MYECSVCKVEVENYFNHFKTSWHLYNLKRQTVGFSSLTLEEYEELQLYELKLLKEAEIENKFYCCGKTFHSTGTYESHLKSKKHSENELKRKSRDENMRKVEEKTEPFCRILKISDCLFCDHNSDNLDSNIVHMSVIHGFRFPYPDYIKDYDGLMNYLIELLSVYNVCLQCNKQFDNIQGVRNHMIDSNHFQLYFDFETNGDDVADFYEVLPKQPNIKEELIEATLPNGKKIVHREYNIYMNQSSVRSQVNTPAMTNMLALTTDEDKAKLRSLNRSQHNQICESSINKKYQQNQCQTQRSLDQQIRLSHFKNIQHNFRDSNNLH